MTAKNYTVHRGKVQVFDSVLMCHLLTVSCSVSPCCSLNLLHFRKPAVLEDCLQVWAFCGLSPQTGLNEVTASCASYGIKTGRHKKATLTLHTDYYSITVSLSFYSSALENVALKEMNIRGQALKLSHCLTYHWRGFSS